MAGVPIPAQRPRPEPRDRDFQIGGEPGWDVALIAAILGVVAVLVVGIWVCS